MAAAATKANKASYASEEDAFNDNVKDANAASTSLATASKDHDQNHQDAAPASRDMDMDTGDYTASSSMVDDQLKPASSGMTNPSRSARS